MFLVDFDRKLVESKKDDYIRLNDDKHTAIGFNYDSDDENQETGERNT